MDGVGKRQCVLTVFIIIQASKVYDWLCWNDLSTTFSLKWSLIETIFLVLLWWSRVPRLSLSLHATFSVAILATAINLFGFLALPSLLHIARLRLTPLSSAIEMIGLDTEMVDDIAGSKENFLRGRHTTKTCHLAL